MIAMLVSLTQANSRLAGVYLHFKPEQNRKSKKELYRIAGIWSLERKIHSGVIS
ncbi:MAG: hypothetical protein WC176_10560 [Candidatus Cloacimonadaceae bacterium]|jgi:hypothetical protein